MTLACIHMERIGRSTRTFTETLVRDDGRRLDTISHPPLEIAVRWSQDAWQANGLLEPGQVVRTVKKHHYYHEWFGIMELFDLDGALLGRYCDVVTPLVKVDDEYYLKDLLLDLWIWPDGRCRELDWDEFENAFQQGLLSKEFYQQATACMQRMTREAQAGIFPNGYLPDDD